MPVTLVDIYGRQEFYAKNESGQTIFNERGAMQLMNQSVVLQNRSPIDFTGPAANVAGADYSIPGGGQRVMTLETAFSILGNPFYPDDEKMWDKHRTAVLNRFGAKAEPMLPDPDDAAFLRRREEIGRPVEWDDRVRDIPQLVLVDPDTGEDIVPPMGWPLYETNPIAPPEFEELAVATAADVQNLRKQMEELQKAQKA